MQVGPESTKFIQQAEAYQKKISGNATHVCGKIEQGAVDILFTSKNSLNKLSDNVTGTAQFVGSRLGVGTDKQTKDMLALYRKSVESQFPQASNSSLNSAKTTLSKELVLFQNEKALGALSKNLSQEISQLEKNGGDNEKLDRLKLLESKLNQDPVFIAKKMQEYKNDSLYLHMQPTKFLSLLVKSNQELDMVHQELGMTHAENSTHKKNLSGSSEKERVALLAYTTGDYRSIKTAARDSIGQIKDPGKREHFEQVESAQRKLSNEMVLAALSNNLSGEISQLKTKSYLDGEDKEKLSRLELLQSKLNQDPVIIAKKMQEYKNDSLYLHMQPTKFLSLLVKSNQELDMAHIENPTQEKNPSGLSEKERIALFAYTTGDYKSLNAAARESKGQIKDLGMREHFEQVKSAYYKLPEVPIPLFNRKGDKVELKRAIFTPPSQKWVDDTFGEGKNYIDHAFGSATNNYDVPGVVSLTYRAPEGSTVLPNTRFLGKPYTAQAGEAEILVEPGVALKIVSVDKRVAGLTDVILQL